MKKRFRDLGQVVGNLPTGQNNAITDVKGVVVGHKTLVADEVCSGLTVIMPNEGKLNETHFPAGIFAFNGTGELTGTHWINETGTLVTPIVFTGSNLLGLVHHNMALATRRIDGLEAFSNGVVGETWDGWLSSLEKSELSYKDVEEAIINAKSGIVEEGNVGGGTAMICFEFKGGIGTSSRLVECECGRFTVGALVQTNFGRRQDLVIGNVKVGAIIDENEVPLPWQTPENQGSLLVAVFTDAPLIPSQCERISKRAALSMARMGGIGEEGSGDFFITVSTGNSYSYGNEEIYDVKMFPSEQLENLFEGTIEAVEEAIINSLCMAETLEGQKGRMAYELPQEKLINILK